MYPEIFYCMKQKCIIFLLLFTTFGVVAQNELADNIKKGDEAMKQLDFIGATMWYEEVVYSNCDKHSISRLTLIWQLNDSLRTNMDYLMKKCKSCLDEGATQYQDTTSMALLVTYYTEGIGMNKNETMAEHWRQRLEDIRNPNRIIYGQNGGRQPRNKTPMQFFAGYSASFIAPVGLTFGGVGTSIGWYLRVRSNMSFQDYTMTCDEDGKKIEGVVDNGFHRPLNIRKVNTLIGTGGIVIKANPSLYLSAGAGYCSHTVLYQFERIGADIAEAQGTFWAKVDKPSFNGVALDFDGTYRIGKSFYGSVGFSVLNFKYVYANAGIGLFFK